ncbi:MAG: type II toxin-antitoxin system RatA family toxin [Burkholderiaceae bacterium]|nr:type II toxin-antitoxin system RatA family toxin [Burkholderiaceae bacterium]
MKHVKKSVLLWYSPREMYALVTAIEDYPSFLPWCERAEVLQRDDAGMTARLTLAKSGVRHAFTTRNLHRPDAEVQVQLVDGPFSLLDGTWRFLPLGRAGTAPDDQAKACRIEFDLRYAFASVALEAVVSPVFDRIANTFVDSFVQRAEQVHGLR